MKNKLILNEDEEDVVNEPSQPEVSKAEDVDVDILSTSSLINQMVKSEWDAVDLYNAIITTIKSNNATEYDESVIKTITDIISEEYIHIGQLEKLLQNLNPHAENINTGIEEEENKEVDLG